MCSHSYIFRMKMPLRYKFLPTPHRLELQPPMVTHGLSKPPQPNLNSKRELRIKNTCFSLQSLQSFPLHWNDIFPFLPLCFMRQPLVIDLCSQVLIRNRPSYGFNSDVILIFRFGLVSHTCPNDPDLSVSDYKREHHNYFFFPFWGRNGCRNENKYL